MTSNDKKKLEEELKYSRLKYLESTGEILRGKCNYDDLLANYEVATVHEQLIETLERKLKEE